MPDLPLTDPLAQVVGLLQPGALIAKVASGAGCWTVKRRAAGEPFYALMLQGSARMTANDHPPIDLIEGDFVLVPAITDFGMIGTSCPAQAGSNDPLTVTFLPGETRHGRPDGPPDARMLAGGFAFGFPDAAVLVSLLPGVVHVRGGNRLAPLVHLIAAEARDDRPGRDFVLARLLEVLMVEALRSATDADAPPGLLRGLADPRLAPALRQMHGAPGRAWTVADLAAACALSRTAFFDRFSAAVGLAPMQYLMGWRMALAKNLLRRRDGSIASIALRIGYGSASAFSAAFTRHVGLPPAQFARSQAGQAIAAAE